MGRSHSRQIDLFPGGVTRRQAIVGFGAAAVAAACVPAVAFAGETPTAPAPANETVIVLSDDGITVNGDPAATEAGNKVFTSNDVIYYEDRDTYDSGNKYGEGEADERHSAEDAAKVTVVNITEPGAYSVSGKLSTGQIRVDLGEDAYDDPSAVVELVLNGVDITCDVAPAVLFLNVFECDNAWTEEAATSEVDTSAAGANVIIADNTVNTVNGGHVAHDDGINTNEDGVSVTTINGGTLHILAGVGAEGDGVDSNGWLVINGGTVIAMANPASDAGLDSDMGSFVNGGTVVALGSTMDWAESDSEQVTMNLQFAGQQSAGDAIVVMDGDGKVVFAYDPSEDETAGTQVRNYRGAVISCPDFEVGATYAVYIGGTVTGSETQGVYAVDSITGYEGGTQQGYTGTDVGGFGPGGMGGPGGPGMGMGPGGEGGEPPAMPDGERPEGMPEPPSGERPEGAPEPPSDGAEPPAMPEGGVPAGQGQAVSSGEMSVDFYMQDKVNSFSGVAGV